MHTHLCFRELDASCDYNGQLEWLDDFCILGFSLQEHDNPELLLMLSSRIWVLVKDEVLWRALDEDDRHPDRGKLTVHASTNALRIIGGSGTWYHEYRLLLAHKLWTQEVDKSPSNVAAFWESMRKTLFVDDPRG